MNTLFSSIKKTGKKTWVSIILVCAIFSAPAFAESSYSNSVEPIEVDNSIQLDMAFFSFATSNSDIYGYNDDLKIFFLKQRFNHFRNLT